VSDCRLLQVYADPKGYWRVVWNLFDFFILLATILLEIIQLLHSAATHSTVSALRIIRTLRIVCIFRVLNHVRGLQILMMALLKTITEWVASAILLLIIIMFVFAIISDHYFHSEENWWGNIGRCLMSLCSYFTVLRNNFVVSC